MQVQGNGCLLATHLKHCQLGKRAFGDNVAAQTLEYFPNLLPNLLIEK
jgi:hypothetical protein